MIVLRNVNLNDLDDLYELSGLVFFINLPHDKSIIEEKIKKSIKSFKSPSKKLEENYYIFVAEDTIQQKIVGVSMIHAQHGTSKEPHFFLKIGQEYKYSKTINTGFVHGTLKLGMDKNGPTEIGGLVVHPDYRRNEHKIGKQLSFVRFLYMGLNKTRFKSEVHSELMPPLTPEGKSPLWEAIGRRFMNMDYYEADKLSRTNKDFILSLYPSENIYQTLLPFEARDAIGKVGTETLPVKNMLENIGFSFTDEVDPFDGGPHYRCKLKNIKPINDLTELPFSFAKLKDPTNYLMLIEHEGSDFLAIKITGEITKKKMEIDINLEEYIPKKINKAVFMPIDY
jgi:arginine N-succinyltransferase